MLNSAQVMVIDLFVGSLNLFNNVQNCQGWHSNPLLVSFWCCKCPMPASSVRDILQKKCEGLIMNSLINNNVSV